MKNLKQKITYAGLATVISALGWIASDIHSTLTGPKDNVVVVQQKQNGDIMVTLSDKDFLGIEGKMKHIDFRNDPDYKGLDYGLYQRLKEAGIKVYKRF